MKSLRIGMASDHAGFKLKMELKDYLEKQGAEVVDFGTNSDASCDYPDFAHALASQVNSQQLRVGIAICGSGNGINMTCNKYPGVRSALCWNREIAELARLHNDANICTLPARYISLEEAKGIVDCFLATAFEGGRHIARVEKIAIK